MTKPVALLDANVFPPVWLLDVLLTMDEHQVFDAVWSQRILEEVRRAMIDRLRRNQKEIENFMDCFISMNPTHCVYGWESSEMMLKLPDADDRHVLAAALVADADYIVTYNLKDFPQAELQKYSIAAVHPDVFLCEMFDVNRNSMLRVMNEVVESKDNPPRTMAEEIAHLRSLRLCEFSERLRDCCGLHA